MAYKIDQASENPFSLSSMALVVSEYNRNVPRTVQKFALP